MIQGFWLPTNGKRAGLLLLVVAMVVLRQSELVGLMNSTTLVFGWIPMQLAYDIAFGLVSALIVYAIYRAAPEPPDVTPGERNSTSQSEGQG